MDRRIELPARFNGPPDSANGGYTCGRVAALLPGAAAAEVSLRSPPPCDRPLPVERTPSGIRVLDGDTLVAEGRPVELNLDVPTPPSPEDAERASRDGYERWADPHPFPTCFVCGPERVAEDGLRIFPGPLSGDVTFAATWTPHRSLAGDGAAVRPEFVWAALDCPTSAPAANFGEGPPVVLARLAARIDAPVEAGAPHVALSWRLGGEGRKREAGAALFAPGGALVACSRALWIELRE
jgi:hypothetical protein